MSLDLAAALLQVDQLAQQAGQTRPHRQARLRALLQSAFSVDAATARQRSQYHPERPFLAAEVVESFSAAYAPTPPPPSWGVASVDGSHIDVDRHLPLSCYLVNLGGCALSYGANPDAQFFSEPHLAVDPAELYLPDPARPGQEEAVQGQLLGLLRSVQEITRLVEAVRASPPDLPLLALVDGTLVLWGLAGRLENRGFVRDAIINQRFLPALDELRALAQTRPVTLAAYVSLPRSAEVVNAMRAALCPHEAAQCRQLCGERRATASPCDQASGVLDREIFAGLLSPGERSGLFRTTSSISRQFYGEHQVYFYYFHAGDELARVEVPAWVAQDERLLALGHALISDQCGRGQGYPVALSEAHEQAVIRGSDRQLFKRMVFEALERQGWTAFTSEKERSKSRPWV